LFSTVLYKPRKAALSFLKPAAPVSVSRVKLFISLYISFVWSVLIAFQLLPFNFSAPIDWYAAAIVLVSAVVSGALLKSVGTNIGPNGVQLTTIGDAS
jgi:hypothetical protein